MKKIIARHMHHWSRKEFSQSFVLANVYFIGSLLINRMASIYVDKNAGAYVPDIILDNLPVVNVDWIMNEGVLIFSLFVIGYIMVHPKKAPFLIKSVSLFIVIRAIFTILTHLGPMPTQTYLDPDDLLIRLSAGRDMFFSGHTGMPFLITLIFWQDKFVRYISLGAATIFGTAVLFGHLHYSIDVFAAFLITYSIFVICQKLFAKDYALINDDKEV